MSVLDTTLRSQLDRATQQARDVAESAAAKALQALAVEEREYRPSMTPDERQLRVKLRAVQRRLGQYRDLVHACAYEHWHRMLFARFLAGNDLLLHPEYQVPVTLDECADLAREQGEDDQWVLAARFAAAMLPGIFPQDDPLLHVRLAPEDRLALEQLVEGLPREVFISDDGLGWTYQFWQTKRKKEVNASGLPVKGADLAAVTQLFTEHYMVQFLLQNTLGAWWLSLHPDSPLRQGWLYYRPEVQHDFSAWPRTAAEVRIIDPCCGSGHFLVEAFAMLLAMHQEEGRATPEAVELVLGRNLYGLEIDARCVQIAAFALALSAWRSGYPSDRELPVPNVACSGLPLGASEDQWRALANGDTDLAHALISLHELFANASEIGSLLDVSQTGQTLPFVDAQAALDHLGKALRRERNMADPVAGMFGGFANGGLRALDMLRARYHLVVTNPPFLHRGKQGGFLREFCTNHYRKAQNDLATSLLQRSRSQVAPGGIFALVNPQNWLFQPRDRGLREELLSDVTWLALTRLGPGAFEAVTGEVMQAALVVLAKRRPPEEHRFLAIDATASQGVAAKARALGAGPYLLMMQADQFQNPDARIVFAELPAHPLLKPRAESRWGLRTADSARFIFCFWELPSVMGGWERLQSTVQQTVPFGGREHVIFWEDGIGAIRDYASLGLASIQGAEAWDKEGVLVSLMGPLPVTRYTGEIFDNNCAVIWPRDHRDLAPIWAFCSSPEFRPAVRLLDQKLKVTNQTLLKVPFDLTHWKAVAKKMGPLPGPHSDDPTQWLFRGNVKGSEAPLQVAVARLLGFRWPEQPDRDELSDLADSDGIVCLVALPGEPPAVDRLRAVLRTAFGEGWGLSTEHELLEQVGYGDKNLEIWLRDGFFEQHAKLFHNRPFIWHMWDGRCDGFSALLNYHGLDSAKLAKLIYTYLNEWIARQQAAARDGVPGAEARAAAAQDLKRRLELVQEGEPPYDIYVRWKPLHEQPMGWNPDLNDGVRLNTRPFVEAGVLRSRFTINWKKDRGHNPDGSERHNDLHSTLEQKRAARAAAGEEASKKPEPRQKKGRGR